jgi:hypothetical protein
MADPRIIDAFVTQMLRREPDAARDVVAIQLLGACSAHLVMMVGGRAAAAALYDLADKAATQHIPQDDHG